MNEAETPIQVDGKLVYVVPNKVLKVVHIPGKLINLITTPPKIFKEEYVHEGEAMPQIGSLTEQG